MVVVAAVGAVAEGLAAGVDSAAAAGARVVVFPVAVARGRTLEVPLLWAGRVAERGPLAEH